MAKRAAFSGPIEIDGGREMYVESRGNGTPTVVFISGFQGAFDDWTTVSIGGKLMESEGSALLETAKLTHVFAYDRPGTTRINGKPTPSTPVTQPTSAADGVRDLHALLIAAKEPGPFVLVAHSMGGVIARLYASRYPDQVVGLVLVDPGSEFLKSSLTSEQWSRFVRAAKAPGPSKELELADYQASAAELLEAPSIRRMPVIVLTADKPFEFGAGGSETWSAWVDAQSRLAERLPARHIKKTNSGHGIQLEQPQLVARAIRDVVEAVRDPAQWNSGD
ncbi:MAG: alpha/beta hydrolase [Fimbriimonadaceae bacterium]|nr:alpha/beta hydrolase [Fimbriimonadaceae bacterium]